MTFNINAQVRLLPPTNAAQIAARLRAQLQGINVNVGIKVPKSAQRQLNSTNSALSKTAASAKNAGNAMSDFGKQAALAGKRFFAFTIATTAILKFAGALKEGVSEAISFQRELVKISQVTGNTIGNLQDLTKEITKLSTTLGTNSSQLLKASRILTQTGLTAKQTQQALQALAKSDLAPTFDDIISTTEGSIAIFRQFGLEANQLEGALGSINAVAGKFAVESSDIIAAVRRTGGAFAAAGGNLNELIALFTSVRSTTRESAESIATGFRTIFTRLQRVRTQNFLENLGINLRDTVNGIENQFVGPLEAIRRLNAALRDLPSTDPRFAQIIEELGGFRQVSKVIPLIQQFATTEKALGVATSGTTSLTKDAITAQQALAIQISKVQEEFAALIRNFTNNSSFKAIVTLMLSLARSLIKVADALEPLTPLIGTLGLIAGSRLIPSAVSGFRGAGGFGFTGLTGRHDGGMIHRFASGGIVPGVGNKDTVPAKLTPGEYVLRKSAVQRIGEENLQHLNSGGPAYGGVYLLGDLRNKRNKGKKSADRGIHGNILQGKLINALADRGISLEKYDILYDKKPVSEWGAWGSTSLAVDEHVGALSLEYKGDFAKNVRRRMNDVMVKAARDITAGEAQINNQDFVPELEAVQGIVFEGAMARLGEPFDSGVPDDKRPMDFPNGIPATLGQSITNHGQLMGIPVDAKRQENAAARKSIKDKYVRELADRLKAGQTFQRFSITQKEVQNAAGGGSAYLPNAMLTPGEFVVSKGDAARIGEDRLDYINRTGNIPGMATGGSYGRMFKPQLTGRAISPGNVGRKKQYIDQLLEYLEKGMAQGLLGPVEKRMLRELRVRKTHIKDDRSRRFGKRFSLMNSGGAYGNIRKYAIGGAIPRIGSIKKYASGGIVGGAGGGGLGITQIGFAIAGISALINQIEGVGDSFKKFTNILTSVGGQFALLFSAMKTTANFFGKFDQNIDQATKNLNDLKLSGRKESVRVQRGQKIAQSIDAKIEAERQAQLSARRAGGPVNVQTSSGLRARRDRAQQVLDARRSRLENINRQRQQQRNAIRENRALAKNAALAAAGLGAFAAVLNTVSSSLEEAGRRDIEQGLGGSRLVAGKTTGGISSGATGGALVGGAIGSIVPVIGTAVGAAVGGVLGGIGGGVAGFSQGQKEANNLIALRNFGTSIADVTYRLEGLAKGTTKLDDQIGAIRSFVSNTRTTLRSGNLSSEGRSEVLNQAQQQIDGFSTYLSKVAQSTDVTKLADVDKGFAKFLDIAGEEVFKFTARLSNISYTQLEKNIRGQIEGYQNTIAIQKKLNVLTDDYSNRIRNIINVSRAFDDVSLTMKRFESVVEGVSGSFSIFNESERLGAPEQFFNLDEFNRILNRDIAKNDLLNIAFPGQDKGVGASLAQDVQAANAVVRDLPAVLLKLRNSIGNIDVDDAVTKLTSEFNDSPKFVRDAIERAARNIIGPEGKEGKLIEDIQNDLQGTAVKLGEGFKPIFETVAKVSQAMTEEANRRLAYIDRLNALLDKETTLRNKSIDIRVEAENIRAKVGNREVNTSLLQKLDENKLKNILASVGGGRTPGELGNRLEDATQRRDELRQKLLEEGIDLNGKVNTELQKQEFVINKTTQALEFLSDISARTSATMKDFEKAQKSAIFKTELLDKVIALSSPEEGRDLALNLRATRIAAATGTITSIPPEFRKDVLNTLKSIGPGELGVLGNRSGDQVIQTLREDIIRRTAAATGTNISEADIEKLASGRSSETEQLGQKLEKFIQDAIQANAQLINNTNTALEKVAASFANSVDKFKNSISDIFNRQKADELNREKAGLIGDKNNTQTALRAAQRFTARFGQGSGGISEERARLIGENLSLIKNVADQRKLQSRLDDFVKTQRDADIGSAAATDSFFDRVTLSGATFGVKVGTPGIESGGTRNTGTLVDYLRNRQFRDNKVFTSAPRGGGRIAEADVNQAIANETKRIASVTTPEVAATFEQSITKAIESNADLNFDKGTLDARRFAEALYIAQKAAADFARSQYNDLTKNEAALTAQELSLTAKEIRMVGEQYGEINAQWEQFKSSKSISSLQSKLIELTGSISGLDQAIKNLNLSDSTSSNDKVDTKQLGGLIHRFAKGGVVPGVGNRDSVLGLLTPGELVVPKMQAGGLIYASQRKKKEDLTADEKKFQAARAARNAATEERLAKLGRLSPEERRAKLGRRPRVKMTEHEKLENAYRARALAKRKTTEQLREEELRNLGDSIGRGVSGLASKVAGAAKDAFASSRLGRGITSLRERFKPKTEPTLAIPSDGKESRADKGAGKELKSRYVLVESEQQRLSREANERINTYNENYRKYNEREAARRAAMPKKTAEELADQRRKAKLLDDIRFRMLDPSRLSEYADVFDNKTLLNMDKSTLEAARARLGKKIDATAQRLRVNQSTAGARIGGGDTIEISGAERQLQQERMKRYGEIQLALKFQEGLEAERERNTKYRTDTEAPNTIGGVIKELYEVYKIGKRGANYISSNNPDYALGLGNVSEFVGTGEVVGGAFGLGSKLLTIGRGTKTTQAAATSVNRAQQSSQAAERTREAAAAAAAAERARKGAAAARIAQASQTAVKTSKLTPNAAKRLMDSMKLGARGAGTAEGETALQVAKSLGAKYGVNAEHLAQFGKIADQATNVRKAAAAERELMRLIELINKANGFQRGSYIPGIGSGDKVHAMLEPGEYVLNRNAVKAVGANTLDRINQKHARFQTGGQVGVQEGGGVAQMAMPDFTFFNEIVQKFGNKVDLLAESVNNINGMEIQLQATHQVEVLINGLSILKQLEPSIANLVIAETNKAIDAMLKSKFPDVGTMN